MPIRPENRAKYPPRKVWLGMVEQARERGGMEAGRAWDKLVVAECRRIAHEVAAGNFIIPERNVTCL